MNNLLDLADKLLPRCPRCGDENYFRVKSAQVKYKGLFYKRAVLRVRYTCECLDFSSIPVYDIEPETIEAYLESKKRHQKHMRDTFGL